MYIRAPGGVALVGDCPHQLIPPECGRLHTVRVGGVQAVGGVCDRDAGVAQGAEQDDEGVHVRI